MQGYGQPIILKADPVTLTPVSQENVRLTPNFNKHLLKIIFSIPAVWDPANLDPAMMKIMGALAAVNQVIFPETPGDGAGQTPALDFRLAGRHACSGGELAALIFMEMNRNPRIIYRRFSMVWEVGCSTNG